MEMVRVGTGSGAKNTRSWKKCGVLRHFAGGLEDDLQCEGNPTPRQQ
jgi:hypothetical protein